MWRRESEVYRQIGSQNLPSLTFSVIQFSFGMANPLSLWSPQLEEEVQEDEITTTTDQRSSHHTHNGRLIIGAGRLI